MLCLQLCVAGGEGGGRSGTPVLAAAAARDGTCERHPNPCQQLRDAAAAAASSSSSSSPMGSCTWSIRAHTQEGSPDPRLSLVTVTSTESGLQLARPSGMAAPRRARIPATTPVPVPVSGGTGTGSNCCRAALRKTRASAEVARNGGEGECKYVEMHSLPQAAGDPAQVAPGGEGERPAGGPAGVAHKVAAAQGTEAGAGSHHTALLLLLLEEEEEEKRLIPRAEPRGGSSADSPADGSGTDMSGYCTAVCSEEYESFSDGPGSPGACGVTLSPPLGRGCSQGLRASGQGLLQNPPEITALHPETAALHPVNAALHPVNAALHPVNAALHPETAALHPVNAALHPETAALHPETAALHPETAALHPETAALHPETAALHPETAALHPGEEGSPDASLWDDCYHSQDSDEAHYITTHEIQLYELDHEGDFSPGSGSGSGWGVEDRLLCAFAHSGWFDRDGGCQEASQTCRGAGAPRLPTDRPPGGIGRAAPGQGEGAAGDGGSGPAASLAPAPGGNGGPAAGHIHLSIRATSRAVHESSSSVARGRGTASVSEPVRATGHPVATNASVQPGLGSSTGAAAGADAGPVRSGAGARGVGQGGPGHCSGASSAVSEMDEADREVRALTARAFRSLAEEGTGFNRWTTSVDLKCRDLTEEGAGAGALPPPSLATPTRVGPKGGRAFRTWRDDGATAQRGDADSAPAEPQTAAARAAGSTGTGDTGGTGGTGGTGSAPKATKMSHLFVPSIQQVPKEAEARLKEGNAKRPPPARQLDGEPCEDGRLKVPHFTVRDLRENLHGKLQAPIHQVRDVRKLVKSSYHILTLEHLNQTRPPEQAAGTARAGGGALLPIVIKCQASGTARDSGCSHAPRTRGPAPAGAARRPPGTRRRGRGGEAGAGQCRGVGLPASQVALQKLTAAVRSMEQLYVFDRNEWKRKSQSRPPPPLAGSHVLSLITSQEAAGTSSESSCATPGTGSATPGTGSRHGRHQQRRARRGQWHLLRRHWQQRRGRGDGRRPHGLVQLPGRGARGALSRRRVLCAVAPSDNSSNTLHSQQQSCAAAKCPVLPKSPPRHHRCPPFAPSNRHSPECHLTARGRPPSTSPPSTSPPSTSPPSTNPPSTSPPSTNPPSTNPPSTTAATIYHQALPPHPLPPLPPLPPLQQLGFGLPAATELGSPGKALQGAGPPPMPGFQYPQTQRKMLLDPSTGQCYLVETPVQPPRKRLFDPETGQYVEVPVPHQQPMTPVPMSPIAINPGTYGPTYMIYPGFLPTPAMMPARTLQTQLSHLESEDSEADRTSSREAAIPSHPAEAYFMESPYYIPTGRSVNPAQASQHIAASRAAKGFSEGKPLISITSQQGPRIVAPPCFDGTTMSFVVEHR
uniref:DUF4585 domain-containing protein n=1 Tax=Callorhinchus milii TaxID=7868 RepID=A0A4W3I7P6_CALMI